MATIRRNVNYKKCRWYLLTQDLNILGSFSVNAGLVNENEKKKAESFKKNSKNHKYYTIGLSTVY